MAAIAAGGSLSAWAAPPTGLSVQAARNLRYMREEEKLAQDVYGEAYTRWRLPAFAWVAASEGGHMGAMGLMLPFYGLPDLVRDEAARGGFSDPLLAKLYSDLREPAARSLGTALLTTGLIEEVGIRDLRKAVVGTEWTRLTGRPYVAQVLSQSEVNAMLHTPLERGRRCQ